MDETSYEVVTPVWRKFAERFVQGCTQFNSISSPAYTFGHPGPCALELKENNRKIRKKNCVQ